MTAEIKSVALRESEEQYRRIIETANEGIITGGLDGRITFVNQKMADMLGYSIDELVGKTGLDFMPGDQKEKVIAARAELTRRNNVQVEVCFLRKDGSRLWAIGNYAPIFDRTGEHTGNLAMYTDITGRKKSEAALREADAQKRAASYTRNLIEVSLDPLVTISTEGKITDVNEATVKATGVPKESLIGTDFSVYFTEPEKASRGYRQVFDKGSVTDYPLTIRHTSGTLMDVLYSAAVYKDVDGTVVGVFAAARDVTARNRIEKELAAHRQHLEEIVTARTAELEAANADLRGSRRAALNLLKDAEEARRIAEQAEEGLHRVARDLERSNKDLEQFAYVASHDLQEPLRAVGGFMGLLKNQYNDKLDDQAREYINFSVEGAERMQGLIEGLLAFSRVGTRGGEFSSVNLQEALDGALANLKFLIAESNAVVTSDPLPVVRADLSQMTQLLQNLVANAVKFHGPRRPEIQVGAQRKERAWEMHVRDNGIGIDPQYFDRIFLIFQRLHTRTQYKGTGIGLAVCKKIVERHGGKIRVESVPQEGSTFYFTIPDKGEFA